MVQHDRRTPHHHAISHGRSAYWATTKRLASLGMVGCLFGVSLAGCSTSKSLKHHLFGPTTHTPTALNSGIVVADEPQAALVGRDVLARGGNAADAAAATAFALSVTLPSRASLGGGGACIVARPGQPAESISFLPTSGSAPNGDRPASVPMLPRGLFLLQLRYGSVQFADTLAPAITLGQQGITVSRTLARDLAALKGPLLSNPGIKALFGKGEDGTILGEGDLFTQPQLTSFLSRLKLVGVGDLYTGALSNVFVEQANKAGAALTRADLRASLPLESAALELSSGNYHLSFLAPPADGGIGSATAFTHSFIPAQNAVSAWRRTGLNTLQDAQSFSISGQRDTQNLPPLPASTSFVVRDGTGLLVGCALTNNNLFGTGRLAGSTGVLLAAAPRHYPRPLLSAAIIRAPQEKIEAVLAASGQNDAAQAVTDGLRAITQKRPPITSTGTGLLNSIHCDNGICHGTASPQGNGLTAQTPAQP